MTPRLLIEPARLAGTSLLRCQTDERLVDLVRAGNDRAFEAIVERYRGPLLRYCGRLLPPGRAEDAVQQAFLNAFSALNRSDGRIELRAWLYRIAHNAALNALRENGWSHEEIDRALGGTETPHDVIEQRAALRTVLNAVQMLPDRQRDAMILRELEGRSYEQIAVELDATGGAVRQLLNRARHTVRAAATALTPPWLFGPVHWATSAPVLERVSHAAAHDGLRAGATRAAGAMVAALAVVAGVADAPPRLSTSPPGGGDARAARGPVAPALVDAAPVAPSAPPGAALTAAARLSLRPAPATRSVAVMRDLAPSRSLAPSRATLEPATARPGDSGGIVSHSHGPAIAHLPGAGRTGGGRSAPSRRSADAGESRGGGRGPARSRSSTSTDSAGAPDRNDVSRSRGQRRPAQAQVASSRGARGRGGAKGGGPKGGGAKGGGAKGGGAKGGGPKGGPGHGHGDAPGPGGSPGGAKRG